MLPSTLAGLLVALVAILPGSVYTWAYERQSTAFGVTLADRTLRFLAASVVFHLILAWPEYALYRWALADAEEFAVGQFVVSWFLVLLVTGIPYAVGTLLGGLYASRSTRAGWTKVRDRLSPEREARVLQFVLGRDPAPRAWDHVFAERPAVYLRVKTVNGDWVAGAFTDSSYAGGFPQDGDLLLEA